MQSKFFYTYVRLKNNFDFGRMELMKSKDFRLKQKNNIFYICRIDCKSYDAVIGGGLI